MQHTTHTIYGTILDKTIQDKTILDKTTLDKIILDKKIQDKKIQDNTIFEKTIQEKSIQDFSRNSKRLFLTFHKISRLFEIFMHKFFACFLLYGMPKSSTKRHGQPALTDI